MVDNNISKPKFQWNTAKDVDGKIPKHVVEFIEILAYYVYTIISIEILICVAKHSGKNDPLSFYYSISFSQTNKLGVLFSNNWEIDSEHLKRNVNAEDCLRLSRLWKACLLKYAKNSS